MTQQEREMKVAEAYYEWRCRWFKDSFNLFLESEEYLSIPQADQPDPKPEGWTPDIPKNHIEMIAVASHCAVCNYWGGDMLSNEEWGELFQSDEFKFQLERWFPVTPHQRKDNHESL